MASLIGGIFGHGGGNELDSALTLQAFQRGSAAGKGQGLARLPLQERPRGADDGREEFPYETTAPSQEGLAIPDSGSVQDAPTPRIARVRRGSPQPESPASARRSDRSLRHGGHASNWELVPARNSATGHPIGVLGPQVGYYQPQVLMEMDIHGPGIDARGATFAGVGLYVLLGHGRDYAWSATTATSDNVDTFAEVLCKDDFHYRWRGRCLPMDKLERTNSWTPNAIDMSAPGSETLTAYRTVHGIVFARGKVHGKRVAFVIARSTYFHEADSALFFSRMNDPGFMTKGPKSFYQAAKLMNFAFNWSYIDSKHIAYQLPAGTRSGPAGPRRTSRSSAPASSTGRASTRATATTPTGCRRSSTRTRWTPTTWSPGTTSRRRAGRRPTTSTPTAPWRAPR